MKNIRPHFHSPQPRCVRVNRYLFLEQGPQTKAEGKISRIKEMSTLLMLIFSTLAIVSATRGNLAINYTVTNNATRTAGGKLFEKKIGETYTIRTLVNSSNFIWNIFRQTSNRKPVTNVNLLITAMDTVPVSTINNQISVSASYLAHYEGDVRKEFTGIVFQEMTRVLQWNGNGMAPITVTEGIADFVRLKAGYMSSNWVANCEGSKWNESPNVTAWFFNYWEHIENGFVAELNTKIKYDYKESYIVAALGQTMDDLWANYKTNCSRLE